MATLDFGLFPVNIFFHNLTSHLCRNTDQATIRTLSFKRTYMVESPKCERCKQAFETASQTNTEHSERYVIEDFGNGRLLFYSL